VPSSRVLRARVDLTAQWPGRVRATAMSQDAREVRVDIRHHTLHSAAPLQESKDGEVFIALDDPPPVRTILAIHDGNEGPHALEVTRVVETDTETSRRGAYGRFRDADLLRGLEAVGTEHLAAGEQPTPSDDGDHTGYAMPAPVVDPDPSDRIDVNELQKLEERGGDNGDDDDASDDDASPADSAPDGESPRRTRRRRGRKRRPN
jgi:hypothetical protein